MYHDTLERVGIPFSLVKQIKAFTAYLAENGQQAVELPYLASLIPFMHVSAA
jgi:hypothetical protein